MSKCDTKRWNQKKKELRAILELHLEWYYRLYKKQYDKWGKDLQKDMAFDFKSFIKSCKSTKYPKTLEAELSKQLDGFGNGNGRKHRKLSFEYDGTTFNTWDDPLLLGAILKNLNQRVDTPGIIY